ncbi:hypothetical protein [Picosynechococcus sp. PCC 7117]|uniref:hypothetical protein n=1 Tax=Picosynechococcus sp. PCC 7117 TaxID=195498 RepID=UPI00081057A5|nr:hypothetical protein [Picosynechococcus sp. PCC 7117]ANV87282.1 hypothetical protein AWQ22_07320 [Picosynechococcus sp. PCC 7117]
MSLNLLDRVSQFLLTCSKKVCDRTTLFWLLFALFLGLLYPILALTKISGELYWIQDDARQHIFWMARFSDPELFSDDLIADYYNSISPAGVSFFYYCLAKLGVDPDFLSKIVPSLLSPLTVFLSFILCLEILPIPFAAFLSSTVLIQNLWLQDGLTSGTAKAFLIPIFLLFLWAVIRKSFFWTIGSIVFLGLFYGSFVLVAAGVLVCQYFTLNQGKLRLNYNRRDKNLAISGLLVAFVVLLPHIFSNSDFEPVISLTQAKQLPEFEPGGRASFFQTNWWDYLFNGGRTGIRLTAALRPDLVYISLLLPIIFLYKKHFPLTQDIRRLFVLNQLLISGFVLYTLAHLFLFKLYLPSRYSLHSLRFSLTILCGLTLVILLDKLVRLCRERSLRTVRLVFLVFALFSIAFSLLVDPLTDKDFPSTGYITGKYHNLYQFLQQTPKDTLVASFADEASNIPSFSQRSVFVAAEYGIPYHVGYYDQFRQRTQDLITAHYNIDPTVLQRFIHDSKIDLWLIDSDVFSVKFLEANRWFNHFQPQASNAIHQVKLNKEAIALWQVQKQCTIFTDQDINVVSSDCILDWISKELN